MTVTTLALAMSGPWQHPARGLLDCCARPTVGEEITAPRGHVPLMRPTAVPMSARGGYESAGWTPRAALGSGMEVPQDLFIDALAATPRRPATPPNTSRQSSNKATEQARLYDLVTEFAREATAGYSCTILELDAFGREASAPRRAHYSLRGEGDQLVLQAEDPAGGKQLGAWPLRATLGAYRAEESALVRNSWRELTGHFSEEELACAAVLELRGGTSSVGMPLLLIEASPERRDRLVVGLRVLRLYWTARAALSGATEQCSTGGAPIFGSGGDTGGGRRPSLRAAQ